MATALSFRSILSDVNKGKFANIYILVGEEPYYIDAIADALQQKVLPEEERDFNQHIYYGPELQDLDTALGTARQFPVMSNKKLVIVREAQGMQNAKKQLEKIAKYSVAPISTTIFAIVYKGRDVTATLKWVKECVAHGAVYFNSPEVRSWELEKKVKEYCDSHKITIQPKAMAMLSDYIGVNIARYFGELEKLRISENVGPEDAFLVSPEIVERNIGISKDFNNFELVSAIMVRDYARAMQIVEYFGSNPKNNPLTVTCSTLFNAFSRILIAHYMPDKSDNALRMAFDLKGISQLRELQSGLRNFSAMSCVRAIRSIRNFDRKSKGVGSAQKDTELIKELIYFLFTQ